MSLNNKKTNHPRISSNIYDGNNTGIENIRKFIFHKSKFTNLQMIELCDNQIEKIQSFTFSDLKFLKYLELSNKKINEIKKFAFYKLHNLEEIKLDGNKLEHIHEDLFRGLFRL